jgi:hypothetical protein
MVALVTGLLILLGFEVTARAATNTSYWAFSGTSGRIIRQPDALGNRVLDYSGVGYKGGTVPIPVVAVKTNVSPVAGDDDASIQAAINYVASLPLDANGFRGAVLLSAGEYQISNSITINASGIVLRGVGNGSDTNANTVLRAVGPRPNANVSTDHAPLIIITGSGSGSTSGATRNITNNYVPVGACSFHVDSTSGLTNGGRVMITRASPANWIHDIGMDLVSPAWTAGSFNVPSERFITRIEGNRIIVDAPLTCAIEAQYGGATIKNYAWAGRITNVGVEDIRGVSDFDPSVTTNAGASSPYYSDELHALDFIEVAAVENGWVRRVTCQYFGYACVHLKAGTRAVTVSDCASLDPVSIITGERRYAFALADAQLCLVQNCYTLNDRHQFVTDSLDTGPNVFVDGWSDNAYNDAGPHFRWGTGAIWDNVTVNGNNLNVRNRGNSGTSHGWAGANEVVWNCMASGFIIESPPTARNWLIGSIGPLVTNTLAVGPHPDGTYDSRNTNVFPNSLYYAQLQDRLAAPNSQSRDYWIGVIDTFSNSLEEVSLSTTWSNAVNSVAGSQPLDGFNIVTNNHWIPFTFGFSLSTNERVVAATLSMAMRALSSANDNVLYLGSTNNVFTFADLGWLPIGTNTNTTVRVLDLASHLSALTSSQLNIAAQGDLGVDWAMLELQVAPVQPLYTNSILPEADAYVRGGTNASLNYGTSTTIDIKADSNANTRRQGYLRWNLAGYSNNVLQARIRLTPTSVGTNGLEHGITLTTSNQWGETTINWNNQPNGGKRFATWIPVANSPIEFSVTPQVQAAIAGDGLLSLELFSLTDVGGPGLASYASRENATAGNRPQLIITGVNTPPTLSAISNQVTAVNVAVGPLPITVNDLETPASNLVLTATTSDASVVPVSNIVFGGSGSSRTVTITPATNYSGVATLTIIVSDGSLAASNSFLFTVQATPIENWRQTYFGTTANAGDAADTADVTGTGQNNLFKYTAGLDPTNPAAMFTLQIANVTNQPAQKNLRFAPLATGRTYLPESSTNLSLGGWQPLDDLIGPFTNGNQVTMTDSNATEPEKFYRLKITYP